MPCIFTEVSKFSLWLFRFETTARDGRGDGISSEGNPGVQHTEWAILYKNQPCLAYL